MKVPYTILFLLTMVLKPAFGVYEIYDSMRYACIWCDADPDDPYTYNYTEYDNFRWRPVTDPIESTCGINDCIHYVSQLLQHGLLGVCISYDGEEVDTASTNTGGCIRCNNDFTEVFRNPTITKNHPYGLEYFQNSQYWEMDDASPFTPHDFNTAPIPVGFGPQRRIIEGDVVLWLKPDHSSGHSVWVAANERDYLGLWREVLVSEYNGVRDGTWNSLNHCPPVNLEQWGCEAGQPRNRLDQIMEYYDQHGYDREVYMFYRRVPADGPPMIGEGDAGFWKEEDSPFEIDHMVVIGNGEVLDIQPNVVVRFSEGNGIVINEGGLLRVNGTQSQPVIFETIDGEPSWNSLVINSNHPSNTIQCLTINDSESGIIVEDGHATIRNVLIDHVDHAGITMTNSSGVISEVTVRSCGADGVWITDSEVSINNLTSESNRNGLVLYNTTGSLANSTIQNNTRWGCALVSGTNIVMNDNVVAHNGAGGVRIWWADANMARNTIVDNGHVNDISLPYRPGMQAISSALTLSCNIFDDNYGTGLQLFTQVYADMAKHGGCNWLRNNMRGLGQPGLEHDDGQMALWGSEADISCGTNTFMDDNNTNWLVYSPYAAHPAEGWDARWSFWGTQDEVNILNRISHSPDISHALSRRWECNDPYSPSCPQENEHLVFSTAWNQELQAQFAEAYETYAYLIDTYPKTDQAKIAIDRIAICKKAMSYNWLDIRSHFLQLAADSSKDSTIVLLCKANAAWCLAKMGDFQNASTELFALIDNNEKQYEELVFSLKLLLAELEADPYALTYGPDGSRRSRRSLDEITATISNHREAVLYKLDQLLADFSITHDPTESNTLPTTYALRQNYPNPFNPTTQIEFDLPEAARVRLMIYNILGQQVIALVDKIQAAGTHSVIWDGKNAIGESVASGVYIYQLSTDKYHDAKKMVLLK